VCVTVPNFKDIVQTLADISQFYRFKNDGRRYLGFLKFRSDYRRAYDDFSIFKMTTVHHLGF